VQEVLAQPAAWTPATAQSPVEPEAGACGCNHFGVRGLVRAFGRRLVAVECGKASNSPRPLDAALLWRQSRQSGKSDDKSPHSKILAGWAQSFIIVVQKDTDSSRDILYRFVSPPAA